MMACAGSVEKECVPVEMDIRTLLNDLLRWCLEVLDEIALVTKTIGLTCPNSWDKLEVHGRTALPSLVAPEMAIISALT